MRKTSAFHKPLLQWLLLPFIILPLLLVQGNGLHAHLEQSHSHHHGGHDHPHSHVHPSYEFTGLEHAEQSAELEFSQDCLVKKLVISLLLVALFSVVLLILTTQTRKLRPSYSQPWLPPWPYSLSPPLRGPPQQSFLNG